MNKSQLITTIKSLTQAQAQLWYDHIQTYILAHKYYPRLRYLNNKTQWFEKIDSDLAVTVRATHDLGYVKLSDRRMLGRTMTQYHDIISTNITRIPSDMKSGDDSIVLNNITAGVDLMQGDNRYSRNLETDVNKLLG